MKTFRKSLIAAIVAVFLINMTASAQEKAVAKSAEIKIQTSAVCGACKNRIEKNISFEKGVTDVVLDMTTKIATITYKPAKTDPDKLRAAISKIGYDADDVKADAKAYENLPACCKKGVAPH